MKNAKENIGLASMGLGTAGILGSTLYIIERGTRPETQIARAELASAKNNPETTLGELDDLEEAFNALIEGTEILFIAFILSAVLVTLTFFLSQED